MRAQAGIKGPSGANISGMPIENSPKMHGTDAVIRAKKYPLTSSLCCRDGLSLYSYFCWIQFVTLFFFSCVFLHCVNLWSLPVNYKWADTQTMPFNSQYVIVKNLKTHFSTVVNIIVSTSVTSFIQLRCFQEKQLLLIIFICMKISLIWFLANPLPLSAG